MGTVATLVIRVAANISEFEKAMAGLERGMARTGARLQTVGRQMTTGITLPIAAVGALSIKAAMDFESSFAGIRKTVDGTVDAGGNLTAFGADLQQKFRALAKEIPISVNELNRIGESAGQLGIKSEHIIGFTKTIAAMGVATNLSSEQAADGMARFANITQMPQEKIENLGSVIVELGNKLAATESEILEFGLRIAGAGEIVGLTEAQILGIGAAFASVGIEAEAGGTAVQKALLSMNSAMNDPKAAASFGAASGMSGDAFKKQFTADPSAAFLQFVEGVGAAGKQGETILRGVGIDDARQIRAFLSMAAAGDLLKDSLKLAGDEWIRNTALAREAEQRYRTFESQLTLFKNKMNDVAITIGTQLIEALLRMEPAITAVLTGIAKVADWFSRLPQFVQMGTFAFLGFAAALGPIAWAFGTIISAGAGLIGFFRTMATWAGISGAAAATGAGTAATAATTSAGIASRAAIAWRGFWAAAAGPVGIAAGVLGAGMLVGKGVDMMTSEETDRKARDFVTKNFSGNPWDVPGQRRPGQTGPQRTGDVALPASGGGASAVTGMGLAALDAELTKVTPNLEHFKATTAATKDKTAEWRKETALANQELTWYLAKLQLTPPILQDNAASTHVLASKTHDLSLAMIGFSQSFNPVNQAISQTVVNAQGAFGSLLTGMRSTLSSLWQDLSGGKGFAGLMNHLGSTIASGFGNILTGGLNSVINMGIQLALNGVKKLASILGNWITGGEEAKVVNPARDAFLSEFGGAGTGAGSGFHNLAAQLTAATGEAGGGSLFRALTQADTQAEFDAARQAIDARLAGGGGVASPVSSGALSVPDVGSSGGGQFVGSLGDSVTVNINAVDGASVERIVPDIVEAVRRNRFEARTELRSALGVA